MPRRAKRSRFELYGDILRAIRDEIANNRAARPTRVYERSNVPYDRFKNYIGDLRRTNLIEVVQVNGHEEMKLTERALEYLDEYARVTNFLLAFGLEEKKPKDWL